MTHASNLSQSNRQEWPRDHGIFLILIFPYCEQMGAPLFKE